MSGWKTNHQIQRIHSGAQQTLHCQHNTILSRELSLQNSPGYSQYKHNSFTCFPLICQIKRHAVYTCRNEKTVSTQKKKRFSQPRGPTTAAHRKKEKKKKKRPP